MLQKLLGVTAMILMVTALYLIFIYAGVDATQGQPFRIFYFHVPVLLMGYLAAFLLGFACIMYLVTGQPKWDRYGAAAAEFGLVFGGTGMLTGMMWAKPIWGKYWVWWDVRLNLQLILVLLFVAYLMLRAYLPNAEKRATLSCVFGLLAMIDVPFNYLAIYFVSTKQHPGAVVSPGGGGTDKDMALAFMCSLVAWTVTFAYLFLHRIAIARVEEEVEFLEQSVHAL